MLLLALLEAPRALERATPPAATADEARELVRRGREIRTALDELGRIKTSALGSRAPLVFDALEGSLRAWGRAAQAVAGPSCDIDARDAVDGLLPVPRVVRRDHAVMVRELRGIRRVVRRWEPAVRRRDRPALVELFRRYQAHARRFDAASGRVFDGLERGAPKARGQSA